MDEAALGFTDKALEESGQAYMRVLTTSRGYLEQQSQGQFRQRPGLNVDLADMVKICTKSERSATHDHAGDRAGRANLRDTGNGSWTRRVSNKVARAEDQNIPATKVTEKGMGMLSAILEEIWWWWRWVLAGWLF